MKSLIFGISNLMLIVHNYLVNLCQLSDKDLHFLISGLISIILYIVVLKFFKLSKIKSYFISIFICTICSILVELIQGYTNTGSKEILDIVYSIIGALVFNTGALGFNYIIEGI